MSTLTTRPDAAVLARLVELAGRAPSVHNTQPWRWRASRSAPELLELHADRSRQLPREDPAGRNLTISCGAALHHAQVAASALGWRASVDRLPEGPGSTVLAQVRLSPDAPRADADAVVDTIERRCTDRRRFTSWPVPHDQLAQLAASAGAWGTTALPLVDVTERFRAELLVHRAHERQAADPGLLAEQATWVDHGVLDGIPSAALPLAPEAPGGPPSRFAQVLTGSRAEPDLEASDGLLVLCDTHDEPAAWLRAGEGLSALWLHATAEDLAVVPLSQVVEVPETREAFRAEVLGGLATPLVLVRVGWQAIGRSGARGTRRRPVQDVLELT